MSEAATATVPAAAPVRPANKVEPFLRMDRMPTVWCPGCGIGTVVNGLAQALERCKLDLDKVAIVSGIGCTGRVAGYVRLDSFHTTHGRPIPFATGLKLANPELKVIVVSGDGDLTAIGGNHFIHAARRNIDMTVICVNNHTYGMTGGQVTPTTPPPAIASTTPYGAYEDPFNLQFLADACGAVYCARWTVAHVRQLAKAIEEALQKRGFSFVEAISPCPTLYARRNRLGEGVDALKYYEEKSVVKHGAPTREVGIGFQSEIAVGKFVDRERATLIEAMNERYSKAVRGYVPYPTGHKPRK